MVTSWLQALIPGGSGKARWLYTSTLMVKNDPSGPTIEGIFESSFQGTVISSVEFWGDVFSREKVARNFMEFHNAWTNFWDGKMDNLNANLLCISLLCIYNYKPRKSNKDQTLPIGGIGNPESMDKPKDQPLCLVLDLQGIHMGVSKNNGTPKSSHKKIGFSMIFTIHFGGFPSPYFWFNTHMQKHQNLIFQVAFINFLSYPKSTQAVFELAFFRQKSSW